MRVLISGGLAIAATVGGLIVVGPMRSEAKDYGQAAQAFPVIEPDLLSTIENRLRRAEASGGCWRPLPTPGCCGPPWGPP